MTGHSARRIASVVAVSAVSALALLSGAASASAATKIKGTGSTLQSFAQKKVFIPGFEAKFPGEQVEYVETGSGPGLESWGNNGHTPEFATYQYVGTDQPPNPTQKAAIETAAGGAKVLSIPTLQAAVAIIYNLPTGCTSISSSAKKETGRMALSQPEVEEIFRHHITKWSELKNHGDTLSPSGCEGSTPITRVVRVEGSGTTAITKKWFYQINPNPVDGSKTWNNLAEENKNLSWPEETENLVRGKGSPGIVEGVADNAGSIGYVNLANAYEGGFGKQGLAKGWATVEHIGGKKPKFIGPELPGPKIAKSKPKAYAEGTSNCAGTVYVNGVGAKFPPKSTEEAWNEVSATAEEPAYPICGFTYDLSLVGFNDIAESERPTAAQIAEVKSYFKFMINESASLIAGSDYLLLPENAEESKSVKAIASKGVEKIS